jgi:glycosyltransferase involved in cell wall biosynthesis
MKSYQKPQRPKILLIIDCLGSGGAQKQIVTLASELCHLGYSVEVFIYYPQFDFFRYILNDLNIPVHSYNKKGAGFSFGLLLSLRCLLLKGKYSVVLSFLDTPSIYSELASIGVKNLKVIVSERNSYIKENSRLKSFFRRLLHSFSDAVVANSFSQGNWIKSNYPWLKRKVYIIYNGYATGSYIVKALPKFSNRNLMLIGIGRIAYQKNQLNLVYALDIFCRKHKWCPRVNWVGDLVSSAESAYKDELFRALENMPHVQASWFWLGERNDVPRLLSESHALIIPSFYEGLPNVLCEALFTARPVIASNVCDHSFLVEESVRGFLCDPSSPESICEGIERFISLSENDRNQMADSAYEYALNHLSVERMVAEYLNIF